MVPWCNLHRKAACARWWKANGDDAEKKRLVSSERKGEARDKQLRGRERELVMRRANQAVGCGLRSRS